MEYYVVQILSTIKKDQMTKTKSKIASYLEIDLLRSFLCSPNGGIPGYYTCADLLNGRENRYAGSFSKALSHELDTGKLECVDGVCEYERMIKGLSCESAVILDSVKTADDGKLVDPSASFGLTANGAYPSVFKCYVPSPPSVDSLGRSRAYAELLLRAAARDVRFDKYETDGVIAATVAALNHDLDTTLEFVYSGTCEPLTPSTVFRGSFVGERKGKFISRFLTEDIVQNGTMMRTKQLYTVPDATDSNNFLKTFSSAVAAQNGTWSGTISKNTPARQISTLRDLADLVHSDPPGALFNNAALILSSEGVGRNPYFAKSDNVNFFVASGGIGDVMATLGETLRLALSTAWYYKWKEHRTLRPEAYGIILAQEKTTGPFGDNNDFIIPLCVRNDATLGMAVQILKDARRNNFGALSTYKDSHILPQTYPEGSPSHPSYPAGHAVVSGALVTILKALFDTEQDWEAAGDGIQYIDELDKLATNVSYGRNSAGVHYAADGFNGILLGERVAIAHLRTLLAINPSRSIQCDPCAPLKFRGFQGKTICIYPADVNDPCEDNYCVSWIGALSVFLAFIVLVLVLSIIFAIAYAVITEKRRSKVFHVNQC